jgi:plasmid replication initiation protein
MRKLFVIVALVLAAFCGEALAATSDEQAVRTVDRALLAAIAGNDMRAVGRLTDTLFI